MRTSALFLLFAVLASTLLSTAARAAGEINIYSYRQEFLIRPFLEKFEADTGIQVNVLFARKGLLERLKAEGANSPADVVLTVDVARLDALAKAGLFQPVRSPILEANVPAHLRHPDGLWFGLSKRTRILYATRERLPGDLALSYEDLARPEWKGRVCMRSAKHVYNRALFASMLAHHGEDATRTWLTGLKANQARKPQGNDRNQIKAVRAGICDVAIGNHYYYLKMLHGSDAEQADWARTVRVIFPNQDGRGAHVNISGVGIARHAPNAGAAIRLVEFLTGETAQRMYADLNYEYPVRPDVAVSERVAVLGAFKEDALPIQAVADNSTAATRLTNAVGLR